MNKTRRLFILIVIGIWVLNAALACTRYSQPGIDLDGFEKIRSGMTEAEVQRILGPPGIHTNRPLMHQPVRLRNGPLITGRLWATDKITVEVVFDSNGKVIHRQAATPWAR